MKINRIAISFTILLFFFILVYSNRIVIVGLFRQTSFNLCQRQSDSVKRLACERGVIRNTVSEGNLSLAITFFKQSIKEDSVGCHEIAHEVGRDFFESYRKGVSIQINDPLSECGYGFWHGFLSGISTQIENGTIGKNAIQNVCSAILGPNNTNYTLCYHGMGLGFVGDPPDESLWGNPTKTVNFGMNLCKSVTNDPNYLEQCIAGVFHQTLNYMRDKQFSYSLPEGENLYKFCSLYGVNNEKPCLDEFGPILTLVTKDISALKTISETKFSWSTTQNQLNIFTNSMAAVVDTSTQNDLNKDLLYCYSLSGSYHEACLEGFYWSYMNRNQGGNIEGANQMYSLCTNAILDQNQSNNCLSFLKNVIQEDPMISADLKRTCNNLDNSVCRLIK